MLYTTNYGLKKPEGNDNYDIANDNFNMDTLDSTIKSISNAVTATQNTANAAIPAAQKGAASGVATLDASSMLPVAQLPSSFFNQALRTTDSPTFSDVTISGNIKATSGEHHFGYNDGGTTEHGFFVNQTNAGYYDWHNNRSYINIDMAGQINLNQPTVVNAQFYTNLGTTNVPGIIVEGTAGWASGMRFVNQTASTGKTWGIYSGSEGDFHFVDVSGGFDSATIQAGGVFKSKNNTIDDGSGGAKFSGRTSAPSYDTGGLHFSKLVGSFGTLTNTANQKIDLYFTGGFYGYFDLTVSGAWTGEDVTGNITKRFAVHLNASGNINNQDTRYVEAIGPITGAIAISDVSWDSTNSRWRVQIAFNSSNDAYQESFAVYLSGMASDNSATSNIMGAALGAVYTTDTTVFPGPTITFLNDIEFTEAGVERHVRRNGGGKSWGMYLSDSGLGLYDWTNSRAVLNYDEANNTLTTQAEFYFNLRNINLQGNSAAGSWSPAIQFLSAGHTGYLQIDPYGAFQFYSDGSGTSKSVASIGADGTSTFFGNNMFINPSGGNPALNFQIASVLKGAVFFDSPSGNMVFRNQSGASAHDIVFDSTGSATFNGEIKLMSTQSGAATVSPEITLQAWSGTAAVGAHLKASGGNGGWFSSNWADNLVTFEVFDNGKVATVKNILDDGTGTMVLVRNDSNLILDTAAASQFASMIFRDLGVAKWEVTKDNASHDLRFINVVTSTDALRIAMSDNAVSTAANFNGGKRVASLAGTGRQIAAGAWADLSGGGDGYAVVGNNVYRDFSANVLKYSQTHGTLGARGFVFTPYGGGVQFFDTGTSATTADATFTPTLYDVWHTGKAPSSFVPNGYQKLPNGLIIQWGNVSLGASSGSVVTFPIAFPSVCAAITATGNTVGNGVSCSSPSNTSTTIQNNTTGTAVVTWIAIGY